MNWLKNFFATRWGIIGVGVFIGVFAPLLQKWGNPGNMGVCVACFQRDIAGAIGLGGGSRRLYEYLAKNVGKSNFKTITLHYLQPDVNWHNRVLSAFEGMAARPILIADAGSMYAAKMSGRSSAYDLFTPDIGELAFLADEEAPHPFYTRGFILHEEHRVPDLIARAYAHKNAARTLLVKGEKDYIANDRGIRATIDRPMEEALEAIGGTGDTLTGIVTALVSTGMEISEAASLAARANRLAGHFARPNAATQVMDVISYIPGGLEDILRDNKKGEAWERISQGKSATSALK